MKEIKTEGFILKCTEKDGKLTVSGYEGSGVVLDLTDQNTIVGIEKKAFLSCKSLRKVFLPESMEFLGDWCFSKCDNLKTVRINKPLGGSIFGRGVFEGSNRIREISFEGANSSALSKLLALNVSLLPNDHLLRSEDLGQQSWFEKWDISLLSFLNSDDAEGSIDNIVCGEEDISYDGVGMVDGEMPGETEEYVLNAVKSKCFLCYMRLLNDEFLKPESRTFLQNYIKERSFGKKKDYAWLTLKEDCEGDMDFYKLYLDIVKPGKEEISEMVADLGQNHVQAKAFLINEASGEDKKSGLNSLLL